VPGPARLSRRLLFCRRDFSLAGLNDPKLLSAGRRAALFDGECALAIGVGQVEVEV
jgi:hypothetical protein